MLGTVFACSPPHLMASGGGRKGKGNRKGRGDGNGGNSGNLTTPPDVQRQLDAGNAAVQAANANAAAATANAAHDR